jgi:hypothetical protein
MLRYFIDLLAIRWNRRAGGITALKLFSKIRNHTLRREKVIFDYSFIKYANSLPISKRVNRESKSQAIFVATKKDFVTLPFAISSVLQNVGIPKSEILVVIPESYTQDLSKILVQYALTDVRVITETELIPGETIRLLQNSMGSRFGWGLQQLLKIQAVLTSKADFIFLCDADTIILNPRDWFNPKKLLLFPTFERNPVYYQFLQNSFNFGGNPSSSFISHHMIIHKSILKEALGKFTILTIEDLVETVLRNANFQSSSPFSLDYEFYAQYVSEFHRDEIEFEKWSNIGISASHFKYFQRSRIFRFFLTKNFQSVSFHSWS